MYPIIEICDLCADECRAIDLKPLNHEESVCEDCYQWHKEEQQAALEELFSEIEISNPVGYGECVIEEGDLI